MSFYAVARGRQVGIFNTWDECKMNTQGYKGAAFKKFSSKEEAENFITDHTKIDVSVNKIIEGSNIKIDGMNAFDMLMKAKPQIKKIIEIEDSMFEPDYYVYTDGSCSNNGRKNAMAGIGVYFGENDARNVSQRVVGKQSNNTGELGAILHLYDIIKGDIASGKKIAVISDSIYAIRCVTTYGKKCEEDGWKSDIPNKEIVKKVYELYKGKSNVQFMHIMAHTGKTDRHSLGNDGADRLANEAIGVKYSPKYQGLIEFFGKFQDQ